MVALFIPHRYFSVSHILFFLSYLLIIYVYGRLIAGKGAWLPLFLFPSTIWFLTSTIYILFFSFSTAWKKKTSTTWQLYLFLHRLVILIFKIEV